MAKVEKAPSSRSAATASRPVAAAPASQEEIARVAYELFERRGRLPGHDTEDWFEAERIVRSRSASRRR